MILGRVIKAIIVVSTYISCIVCFILALVFRIQHWGQYTEFELIKINAQKYWFNLVLVFISYIIVKQWQKRGYK